MNPVKVSLAGRAVTTESVQSRRQRRSKPLLLPLIASGMLALPGSLLAQAASAPSAAAATDTVRMNPFEVVSEQDGSFQTNSIGTGSRLTLNLKDTPVAYSSINREFIDALGITDLREAASWATGQTFYYADNGGTAFGTPSQYFSRGLRTDQNGANAFGAQRNFYQNANVGGDSYSVESYDFGRGPNAALLGQSGGAAGGLAGVSSIQSKKARFDAARTTVVAEVGQWGYRRVSVDYNRPVSERLGVRLNAVDSDSNGYRFADMRASRGLTITGTWKATNSTDITLEAGQERNAFHTVGGGMDEYLSGWDGQTVFRGPVLNSMVTTNATPGTTSVANASYGTVQLFGNSGLTWGGEGNGVDRLGANTFRYDPNTGTVMNYQNVAVTRRADATSRVPLWSSTAPNGSFFVRGTNVSPAGARFGTDVAFGVGRSWYGKSDPGSGTNYLPADMFNRVVQNSTFRIPSRRFTYSLDQPTTEQISRDLTLTIAQRVGSALYLELGGNINRNYQQTKNWDNPSAVGGGGRTATLDINQILPNGAPNPHFLDTYSAMPLANQIDETGDQAVRVNAAYVLNAGKWGNYTFNLNGNASQRRFKRSSFNLSIMANADVRRWPVDQLRLVSYAADRTRGYSEPINGKTVQFTDVNWADGNNPVILAATTKSPNWVSNANQNITFYQSRYLLLQTTAKWWNERVIFTGAFRRDVASGSQKQALASIGDLPATWNGTTEYYRPDAPADYFTMTYVQKNTTTGAALTGKPVISGNRPRTTAASGLSIPVAVYATDRFRDDYNAPKYRTQGNTKSAGLVFHVADWISPYINYSNSFLPSTGYTVDMNNELRQPVSAYGYDWGTQLSFLSNKLNIKYNYYSNFRENDNNNNGVLAQVNNLYRANVWNDSDSTDSGRNGRGVPDLPGTDYQNLRNFGYEIEVSANLAPGLRVTANGSMGSRSADSVAPLTRNYVPANADVFKQILEDAGGRLDTTQKPAGAPSAPGVAVGTPIAGAGVGIDTTNAVNAYNNIWVQYDTLLVARNLRTPNQPTLNVFGDYTLQAGRLKGLRVGAGVQWQGSIVLGNKLNETILDPSNPVPTAIDNPAVDQFSLRKVPGSYQSQINLAYTFRLPNGNNLALALRVNNPVNTLRTPIGDGNVAFGSELRQPNGDLTKPNRVVSPALPARFPEPINARLTATYSFGGWAR